jgi:aryl-alcohol dehydrogenase-like predicted oxidoreductase
LAEAGHYGQIDVLQPPYNLFWRFSEQAEVPYCREHSIGIMTYSSLAHGLLTGQLTAETQFAVVDRISRTVMDALPAYPDMFGTWRRWELQQRRYQRSGRLPSE